MRLLAQGRRSGAKVDQATQEGNRIRLNRGFFVLCFIALVVFLALGVLRSLMFGPWWSAPYSAAQPSALSAAQSNAHCQTTAQHPRTSSKANQQASQAAR